MEHIRQCHNVQDDDESSENMDDEDDDASSEHQDDDCPPLSKRVRDESDDESDDDDIADNANECYFDCDDLDNGGDDAISNCSDFDNGECDVLLVDGQDVATPVYSFENKIHYGNSVSDAYFSQDYDMYHNNNELFGGFRGLCWRARHGLDLHGVDNVATSSDAK